MKNTISFWLDQCVYGSLQTYEVLAQAGYTHDWLNQGDLGGIRARIEGRFFTPDPEGAFWVAQPVWQENPTAYNYVESPLLDDIIVWQPHQPERWSFLRGEIGLILGEQNLFHSQFAGEKAVLHKTPLEWLKARSAGSVLLDWHGLHRLLDFPAVVCTDVKHGMELREQLNTFCLRQMPEFYVPSQQGARS